MGEYKTNRVIRANRGTEKQAKSWLTEAAFACFVITLTLMWLKILIL